MSLPACRRSSSLPSLSLPTVLVLAELVLARACPCASLSLRELVLARACPCRACPCASLSLASLSLPRSLSLRQLVLAARPSSAGPCRACPCRACRRPVLVRACPSVVLDLVLGQPVLGELLERALVLGGVADRVLRGLALLDLRLSGSARSCPSGRPCRHGLALGLVDDLAQRVEAELGAGVVVAERQARPGSRARWPRSVRIA